MTTEQAPLWFQNFVKQYETDTKRNFKEHADLASKVATVDSKVATVDSKVATVDSKVATVDNKIESLDSRFIGLETYVKDAVEGSPSPGL